MNQIGKIKKVPLREIWKKEDKDFSMWLEENIDYLNEILPFEITIESREANVGPFRVDLYGVDSDGNKVIIENQLEKTDHDHLGKIITYLTNLEANTAIWITSNPTEEHSRAIEWLNEISPENISFFLIKLEAIRIEPHSTAAPLFTIVQEPGEESRQLGEAKKQYAQQNQLWRDFWTGLLEKAQEKTKLHSNISPSVSSWISTGAGKSSIGYNYNITAKEGRCEVYLDHPNADINKHRFDQLFKWKEKVENIFGGVLHWERLEGRIACRISCRFKDMGLKDREQWDSLQEKMIDAMIRLEKAFKPYIENLT